MVIFSYLGGLRFEEVFSLRYESVLIERDQSRISITINRKKQRSDKQSSNFYIPLVSELDFNIGELVVYYYNSVAFLAGKSGMLWFRGTNDKFINQSLGSNSMRAIAKEVSMVLGLCPKDYLFHSFRRSAVTAASESGVSADTMTCFFGWKTSRMAQVSPFFSTLVIIYAYVYSLTLDTFCEGGG